MPHAFRWQGLEFLFLVAFTVELALRISVVGWYPFFKAVGQDFMWNMLDFTLVSCGLITLVVDICVGQEAKVSDTTLLRMIRLLRLARVLRIIRIVRFLKQLYLLAYGFVEGALAVFWVTLLAASLLYMCSIVLVRSYGTISWEDEPEEQRDFFIQHFGSIPRSMYSLFQLMCAPDLRPWHDDGLFDYPGLVCFLVTFIIVGSFGVNGLLVALINESILERNQARIEAERLDREAKRTIVLRSCHDIFDRIDVHKNRVLPRSELSKCKDDIADLIEHVNIDFRAQDLDQMFYIMDYNDTGIIEREEFANSVVELCDHIRPMSIMELHCQISKCAAKVEDTDSKVDSIAKSFESYERRRQFESSAPLTIEDTSMYEPQSPTRNVTIEGAETSLSSGHARIGKSKGTVSPREAAPKLKGTAVDLGRMLQGGSENRREVREALAAHYYRLAEAQDRILAHLKASVDSKPKSLQAIAADQLTLAELGTALTTLQRANTDVLEVVLAEVADTARSLQPSPGQGSSSDLHQPCETYIQHSDGMIFKPTPAPLEEVASDQAWSVVTGRRSGSGEC